MKILIIGNIGSGKQAMAERLTDIGDSFLIPLDELHNGCAQTGRSMADALRMICNVLEDHINWVVECSDGDLAEVALPYCEELCFMNPGIEACIKRCRKINETHKHTPDISECKTDIDQAVTYEYREDSYGLQRHRELFDSFNGKKREYTAVA